MSVLKQANFKILAFLVFALFSVYTSKAAYLENLPVVLQQPDGSLVHAFASGDEYCQILVDEYGRNIDLNEETGYYCYATYEQDSIYITNIIARDSKICDVDSISCGTLFSLRKSKIVSAESLDMRNAYDSSIISGDTLNNVLLFVGFQDRHTFPYPYSYYDSLFNVALRDYYLNNSYGKVVVNTICPMVQHDSIIPYIDDFEYSYYCDYTAENVLGYHSNERYSRECALVKRVVNSLDSTTLLGYNLDFNGDGKVDNITIVVSDGDSKFNSLLWPHKNNLNSDDSLIMNSCVVYNFVLASVPYISKSGVNVLAHEIGHVLGAPDLYHKVGSAKPVGDWDIMANSHLRGPQHMLAHVKYKYCHWIDTIPNIKNDGIYSLNPIDSSSNNCYKIQLKNTDEYLMVEYRTLSSVYDCVLPQEGLLVYRIRPGIWGNYYASELGGKRDEIYVYRVDGNFNQDGVVEMAPLNILNPEIYNCSNPSCFLSNADVRDVSISFLKIEDGKLFFEVRYGPDVTFENTIVPSDLDGVHSLHLKNITFPAHQTTNVGYKSEVVLESALLEKGSELNIYINKCCDYK